ncbi:MAG: GIY-YIG nuclease family protein [Defluviitaleaceae bacterium]|nr:GIY-YIG nuclease family protein [Defluviitaleaceae bacterium]
MDISHLPHSPGCYIFKDSAGDYLYVGKSKNVKNRVASYFNKNTPPKVQKLSKLIAKIEYRPAATEIDALYLEHSLIKTYRPPFNVQMNKDFHPHHICINWNYETPGLYISDKPDPQVTRYGSFSSPYDAKEALTIINRAWATPTCGVVFFAISTPGRGCLNLHIGQCMGPCQTPKPTNYNENLTKAASFMQGKNKQAITALEQEMKQAANDLNFEKAAKLKDTLNNLAYLHRRFSYRVPFAGRRLCIFIRGYNEPGFLLLYYKNGQLRHSIYSSNEDWPKNRDYFINTITGEIPNNEEQAKIYTTAATGEIRARKLYVDVTKTKRSNLLSKLDKAAARFR